MSASKQDDKGEAETLATDKKATVETQKARPASSFTKGLVEIVPPKQAFMEVVIGVPTYEVGRKFAPNWIAQVILETDAELIAEAFNVATETGLTPSQLQRARDESYGIGVSAGKLEALQYTPEERERYGKWAAEGEMCSLLVEQKKKLLEALKGLLEVGGHIDMFQGLRMDVIFKDAYDKAKRIEANIEGK